ncbi:LANO_0E12024g1_1 [Lachancea nothofagi CBS 11611]|uniref:Centractin n=1 Tax=Lachancea nothofagi CBS 11611 TaxID=1266666 RepID=A0A1G4JY24_9SACH|nr:LANO_0E12024g1_1 [Lachancea nothofagi CBS 11611]
MSEPHGLYNQPIVLDNGSGIVKAGFSGEEKPKCFEYSLIGTPKYSKIMAGGLSSDAQLVGNEAQKLRGLLKLQYPIEHGVVKDWQGLELLWSHVFQNSLKLNSAEDHPVLVTEAPLNPLENREKMCEMLFDTFNIPAVYVSIQAVLALYAGGRTTGCVIDCGDGVCHSVPVYDGFTLPSAVRRIDVAGRDITEFLQLLLRKSAGVTLLSSSEREIVRMIKEKSCYVATNIASEEQKYSGLNGSDSLTKFKLPDGKVLSIGAEKFRAAEILFQPQLIGSEFDGVQDMCHQSILRVDRDLRTSLYSNVVLSGGTTMFPGFGDRLLNELRGKCEPNTKIKIFAPPERKFSTWIGGSILAGLSTFERIWVTKSEWQENPQCVHSRFM